MIFNHQDVFLVMIILMDSNQSFNKRRYILTFARKP